MSDKPDKNNEFHGINPHESLVRSLESIKSLLQQGDSKILKARESIARASVLSKDAVKDRFNEPHASNHSENKSLAQNSATEVVDTVYDHEFVPMLEDIVTEQDPADDDDETLNQKHTNTEEIEFEIDHQDIHEDIEALTLDTKEDSTDLLAEVIQDLETDINKEINNDIVFQESLEEEFKPDADFEKMIDKMLNEADDSDPIEIPELEIDNSPIAVTNVSSLNDIVPSKDEVKLDPLPLKQELVAETTNNSETDTIRKAPPTNHQEITDKVNLSLVEAVSEVKNDIDKNKEPVVIKETTPGIISPKKPNKIKSSSIDLDEVVEFDKDELKTIISDIDKSENSENKSTFNDTKNERKSSENLLGVAQPNKSVDSISQIQNDLEDVSFNSEKLMILQKRVEKRIHNRLIQIIVQLDGDIHRIFKEEMDKCLQNEKESGSK